MLEPSPFPERIRIDFSAEAWRCVGGYAKRDFDALRTFLEDLAERLTLASIDPPGSPKLTWRFVCEDGPSGVCELDRARRKLTVLTVERGG